MQMLVGQLVWQKSISIVSSYEFYKSPHFIYTIVFVVHYYHFHSMFMTCEHLDQVNINLGSGNQYPIGRKKYISTKISLLKL